MNIKYSMWANSTEVELDKWLYVDSVDVRIDRGIFGIKTYSNNIELVENKYCTKLKHFETYEDEGRYYSKRRCFSQAIQVYSDLISAYPKYYNGYYYRGRILLVKKQYKLAFNDFKSALRLRIKSLDKKKLNKLKNINLDNYISKFITNITTKKNVKIGSFLKNSKIIYELKTFVTLINYCNNKL
ncbi:MAG: hypothetical protein HYR91_10445 [Flavobacteriia bacterium]|nr:hypothetical protein [Flavobacteriia bacterium]